MEEGKDVLDTVDVLYDPICRFEFDAAIWMWMRMRMRMRGLNGRRFWMGCVIYRWRERGRSEWRGGYRRSGDSG